MPVDFALHSCCDAAFSYCSLRLSAACPLFHPRAAGTRVARRDGSPLPAGGCCRKDTEVDVPPLRCRRPTPNCCLDPMSECPPDSYQTCRCSAAACRASRGPLSTRIFLSFVVNKPYWPPFSVTNDLDEVLQQGIQGWRTCILYTEMRLILCKSS